MSPDEARTAAARAKAEVAQGADPVGARRESKAKATEAKLSAQAERERRDHQLRLILADDKSKPTTTLDFSVLADASLTDCARAYKRHGARGNSETLRNTEMHLRLALKEMEAEREKPGDLKQSRVASMVRLHDKNPATGRQRLGSLSRLYKWLRLCEATTNDPTSAVKPPAPPPPRTTVYTADELQRIWRAADTLPKPRADFLRLAVLLPLRRQELADLYQGDIQANGERMEIVIPAARTKNGREHRLPLVGKAKEIVTSNLIKDTDASTRLLSLTEKGTPMNAWRRFSESVRAASNVKNFALHDFRRLFATETAEHEVGDFTIIDGLLNHAASLSKPGASRAYDHARRAAARGRVLEAWDKIVLHAVERGKWPREMDAENNVVALHFGSAK
jgi:integrase